MGGTAFKDRDVHRNTDGTPLRHHEADIAAERVVAEAIEKAWKCVLKPWGKLCPLDWYALRHERLVGVLELKNRAFESSKYATTFLNARKWLNLTLASHGLGVPGVFVVRFTDEVRWIDINDIDARRHRLSRCVKAKNPSHSDNEPVIEVEVSLMRVLSRHVPESGCEYGK